MISLKSKVEKWFKNVKSKVLIYRDGFYEIPFIANSPETFVGSSSALSIVKHFKDKNFFSINNLFVKLELNYYKIEEGLWIMYSETEYKKNIKFVPYSDDDDTDANNYYILSINQCGSNKLLQIEGQTEKHTTTNSYWCFFKPKGNIATYNFKKSESKYLTIYFTKQWMQKNLGGIEYYAGKGITEFINSDKLFVLWPELSTNHIPLFPKIKNDFMNFRENGVINLLSLKSVAYQLVQDFIALYHTQNIALNDLDLQEDQRNLAQRIENYLQDNLMSKFEGIESLAAKFNVSETKLKNDFKRVYGKPIYQYFNEHQMLFAKDLLINKKFQIKEIAFTFGYETPGKFSQAFKKHIGILPSELL